MAFDYSGVYALATELIAEFGRSMTIIRLDRTSADVSKPWRGPDTPRLTPDASQVITGVMVEPGNDLGQLGDQIDIPELVSRSSRILIVAAGSAPGVDLETYDEILDGGKYYKANIIHVLQPGDTKLMYFFEVTNSGT